MARKLLKSVAIALTASLVAGLSTEVSRAGSLKIFKEVNRYESSAEETYLPPWIKKAGYETLMIVLDVSGSMKRDKKLKKAKEGILRLLDQIEKTKMNVKVGLIAYSTSPRFLGWYEPSQFKKLRRVISALKAHGYTATGPAMEMALSLMKSKEAETFGGIDRKCVAKVAINVTDGEWNIGVDPVRPSYELWKAGVKVYAVPVLMRKNSSGWNTTKWESIVGGFVDLDGNGKPCNVSCIHCINSKETPLPKSCPEWDGNGDSYPDTFYPVNKVSELSNVFVAVYYDSLDRFYGSSTVLNNKAIDRKTGIAVVTSYKPYDADAKEVWTGNAFYYFLSYDRKDREEPYKFYSDSHRNRKLDSRDYEVKWLDRRELAIELLDGKGRVVKVVNDFNDAYPIVSLAKSANKSLGLVYFGTTDGKVYPLDYYTLSTFARMLYPYNYRTAKKIALYVATGRLKFGLGDNVYGGNAIFSRGGYAYYVYLSNRGFVHVFYVGKEGKGALEKSTGKLLLSYSPTSAVPNLLKVLANDVPSVHYFLVDGVVRYYPENDVLIGTVGWGKSKGGSSVFCLKLKGVGKNLAVDPSRSWDYQINEYSTAGFVKVGDYVYVFAGPSKTPVEAKANTAVSSGTPKFYVLNLKTGRLVGKYSLRGEKGFFGSVKQESSVDVDGDGVPDYVFASVDYNGKSGAVVAIDVRDPENPKYYVVKSLQEPIVEAPIVGTCKGSRWVYFGTGSLYTAEDNYKTVNYLYGLKVLFGADGVSLGDVSEFKQCSVAVDGWKVALDPAGDGYSSERSITSPFFVGDQTVGFMTTKIGETGCANTFESRYWFLECDTGLSAAKGCETDSGLNEASFITVQLSTGNLNTLTLTNSLLKSVVSERGYTEWFSGVAPTSSPTVTKGVPESVKVLYEEEVAN